MQAEGQDILSVAQVRRVRAVLALGGVPRDEHADGVQQVRLRLVERLTKGVESPRDLGAWAVAVASNYAVDWHRSRSRQERVSERLRAMGEWRGAVPGPESELLTLAIAEGVDALPALQRQVVVLRFYADLTVPQMAEVLAVPVGTVKSRLHAAVRAMRVRLEADGLVGR
ncbi:sigma-70 family RNA polymerase sigma factor [Streptomyces cyaneochromogenes]|uniref:Sigma-70 family RNA polymerase sigma factor n=1 Tax=Streptomyces cyaneochromogenes TaxID=2496836 RepID=A0A3Q9EW61_9ACTN|nr:sigma-70 family RNA polymerase sigma factor [Streptomyces cyaneochromogenes]AZQ40438.1 sigma-70 family RNA polymerase sigma factor [Streptomyces cyaneochromogenes]